jgi:hypothetical protein
MERRNEEARNIEQITRGAVTSIHLSAWKVNSPKLNFRFTEFSEVQHSPVPNAPGSGIGSGVLSPRHKLMFVERAHPQFRIFIHQCYKRYRAGAMWGVWRGDSRGIGAGLCRILDMNFREFVF